MTVLMLFMQVPNLGLHVPSWFSSPSSRICSTETCAVGVLVLLLTSCVILANYFIDLFLSFLICKMRIITVTVTITCFNIHRVLRIVIWTQKCAQLILFLALSSLVILCHLSVPSSNTSTLLLSLDWISSFVNHWHLLSLSH